MDIQIVKSHSKAEIVILLEDKENSDFLMFDSQISLLTSDEIDMISGSGAGNAVAGAIIGGTLGGLAGYGGYEIGEWLDS